MKKTKQNPKKREKEQIKLGLKYLKEWQDICKYMKRRLHGYQ